jgi:2-polyprenyl-6-methoxyphenol hydroxylase-like FAD-dependent oxidoreductase
MAAAAAKEVLMASIVITGGGVGGLTAAMVLADDGHQVTLLERDAAAPPTSDEAWERWERRGVNQFRMLHFFLPRFRHELERELPRVLAALEAAGAGRVHPFAAAPEELTGGWRPGDEAFEALTGRRPVVEAVLAATAETTAGVTVRRGQAVAGLLTGAPALPGVPHVTGVRTASGEELRADLVVDATGRRSPLPSWLEAAGARAPLEELDDSGFVYFARHFRSPDGAIPPIMGPLLQAYGSVSALTLPADNGTWAIGVIASSRDSAMRRLKDVERWTAVVKSLPLVAHWLDGQPLSEGVDVMAKIEDRHRSFTVEGAPVATGIVAVADSWACTNPSVGRGASIGLLHVLALRDTLRSHPPDDPAALAEAFTAATDAAVEPWYRVTVNFDRHRLAEIDGEIEGEPYRPDSPEWDLSKALNAAGARDPDCLRAAVSIGALLRLPDEVMAQPGLVDKIEAHGGDWRDAPDFGPTRAELLSVVAG